MSTDWHNLLKQRSAIQAAMGPINLAKDLTRNPALIAFQKSQLPVTSINQIIQQMFARERGLHSMKTITEVLSQRTFKSNSFLNPAIWGYASEIVKNQHSISSIFFKNLSSLPRNIKVPVASPAFLSTAFDLGYTSKLTMMQKALEGVGRQITVKGFAGIDMELLKKFQETTSEAVALTEDIAEGPITTSEAIQRLEAFVETTFENFKINIVEQVQSGIQKSQKSGFALMNLWITIISIILSILTIVQFYQSQNDPTKDVRIKPEQIQELKVYVDEKFQKALNEASIKVKAKFECNLRYNPSYNSSGFFRINAGDTAHIIESKHKWIRITVMDPADDLPVSGWVLRKHFVRDE